MGLKADEPNGARAAAMAEAAVREGMAILHARTGNDYQHDQPATVLRRLVRRMLVTAQPHLPTVTP